MTKGYLVFEIEITDPVAFERYRALASHLPAGYDCKMIVANGKSQSLEGEWAPASFYILEFSSCEEARAFYFSPEYQSALPIRLGASISKAILIEGMAEPGV